MCLSIKREFYRNSVPDSMYRIHKSLSNRVCYTLHLLTKCNKFNKNTKKEQKCFYFLLCVSTVHLYLFSFGPTSSLYFSTKYFIHYFGFFFAFWRVLHILLEIELVYVFYLGAFFVARERANEWIVQMHVYFLFPF